MSHVSVSRLETIVKKILTLVGIHDSQDLGLFVSEASTAMGDDRIKIDTVPLS
jgi:hypothetical protein